MAGIAYQDLIVEALGHLKVYQDEPLPAADLNTCFFTLLAMLDGWFLEPLTCFDILIAQFMTQANKQAYNLGTANGNDWVVGALPPEIQAAGMMLGVQELPVDIVTNAKWQMIGQKSLASNIVQGLWPNYGAAAHVLSLFPVPNAAIPINLYLPLAVAKPAAPSSLVVLPGGYQEPVTFELAVKVSSKFGANIPAWLPDALRDAKEKVRAKNFQSLDIRCDDALLSSARRTGGGSIDFYTGK